MSTIDYIASSYHSEVPTAEGLRIGIAVADWNSNITETLLEGAKSVLHTRGAAEVVIFRVPGAFELVNASARLRAQGVDAVIAIGCVVRGDTAHFDYICQGVTSGLSMLNAQPVSVEDKEPRYVPVIFGVLTTEDMGQAEERAGGRLGNKGVEAAETALKMCRPVCIIEK